MNSTRNTPARVDSRKESSTVRRAAVVVPAAIAALAVWVVAVPILGKSLTVQFGPDRPVQEVGPVSVFVTALVAGLVAWASLAGLERLLKHATTIWISAAVVVLLASLSAPLTSGTSSVARVTLIVLHLVVGAILISGLPGAKSSPPTTETS